MMCRILGHPFRAGDIVKYIGSGSVRKEYYFIRLYIGGAYEVLKSNSNTITINDNYGRVDKFPKECFKFLHLKDERKRKLEQLLKDV